MAVPQFRLPSDQKIVVAFREPTVNDCIEFCALNDELDELTTTTYLNTLQTGELQNSADWTAQDRRTAIWWIFVTTNSDTSIAYEFPCQHCGETHTELVDLVDLDETASTLTVKPFIDDEIMFSEKARKVRLHPFNGHAMQQMEVVRNELKDYEADSPEYHVAKAELTLLEVVHSFDFIDSDLGFSDALAEKLQVVKAMPRLDEFSELVAACEAMHIELQHGLECSIVQGSVSLVSPMLLCRNNEEGQTAYTRLLIPFLCKFFLPEI